MINDARITILQQALGGLARRQAAITANLANVDTPGYQRRDVPFEAELRSRIGGAAGGATLATTAPGHLSRGRPASNLLAAVTGAGGERDRITRNDQNQVDVDYEMAQLAETQLRYSLLTQATGSRFTTLRDIVSRVS